MTPEALFLGQLVLIIGAAATFWAVAKKTKPEVNRTNAETDHLRVTAQAAIIDDLQQEVERHKQVIRRLQSEHDREKAALRVELDNLRTLNIELQQRMRVLEQRLRGDHSG